MKIAVIGTGGVGGYFGARLADSGEDVTFIARDEHLDAIKSNGLYVKSILGDVHVQNPRALGRIEELEHPGLVIICVKAWQIRKIRTSLKNIISRDTVLLPLQNGVTVIDELGEEIDSKNIIGGLCRIISRIESPGVIHHSGITPSVIIGETDKSVSERIIRVNGIFKKAGIDSKISDDIEADIWKKFIAICVSGLLAVSKTTYGELRKLKETRLLMTELIREVYNLARKAGINIEQNFVKETVALIDSFPFNSTSSLTRDVLEGRPSEIEYQNGAVVKLGKKLCFPTPLNKFIYNCILPMEIRARERLNEKNNVA